MYHEPRSWLVGFDWKTLLALLEEETVPSAARCGSDPPFQFLFDTYMISLRFLILNSEVKEMAASSSCNVDNAASIPLQEKELDECRRRVKELEAENYINEQTIRKLQDQSEVIRQIVILTTAYHVIAVTTGKPLTFAPGYLPVPLVPWERDWEPSPIHKDSPLRIWDMNTDPT